MRTKDIQCLLLSAMVSSCGVVEQETDLGEDLAAGEDLGGAEQEIRGGSAVNGASIYYSNVVSLGSRESPFCTGTLIGDRTVLTAAHCGTVGSTFDVNFVPGETIAGTLTARHPKFEYNGVWLAHDFAIVTLSRAAAGDVTRRPIANAVPAVNSGQTLVGFGGNSDFCNPNVTGTRRIASGVGVDYVADRSPGDPQAGKVLVFDDSRYVCPGDSGGPTLNSSGQVTGVASWGSSSGNSNYHPATPAVSSFLGVEAFDLTGFGGASQVFLPGSHSHAAMTSVGNDRISSLRIAPGVSVRLWAESGAWGDMGFYSGDVWDVGGLLNNRGSHIEVIAGATLYSEAGLWGAPQTFVPGWYDVGSLNIVGNDTVSSLTAGPNVRITVCSEAGFWGDCQDFTGSVPYVGNLLNDRISSIIVTAM